MINVGRVDQCLKTLSDSTIYIKSDIDNEKYTQYYYNKLKCSNSTSNSSTTRSWNIVGISISPEEELSDTMTWKETVVDEPRSYTLVPDSVFGYNFAYISVPSDKNFKITDELNTVLYDSTNVTGSNYAFEYAGKIKTSTGRTNNTYRKISVYNTYNIVKFSIELI